MTNYSRSHKLYFGAGPAALPEEVLQQASEAVINYSPAGLSILEIPHRGKHFQQILEEANALVLELCGLSNDDYEVLWLQGGGRLQFCMVPMNFAQPHQEMGYIDSGHWANEAMKAAQNFGRVNVIASSEMHAYTQLPKLPQQLSNNLSFLHFTTNNTIYGTQWKNLPKFEFPLIADMSSDFLAIERPFCDFDLFYACAQKNIGPAGVTLVVVKKEMLKKSSSQIAPMLSYAQHAQQKSLFNTPPVFAIYTSLLMMRWTKTKGINNLWQTNQQKAALLYQELERNSLFVPTVLRNEDRSLMNVCFVGINKQIEKDFLSYCQEQYILGIEGHRLVGGFRVSLYNAVTLEAVQVLISAMQTFEKQTDL